MSSFHMKKNNFLKIRRVNKNVDFDKFQQNNKKRKFSNFRKNCIDEKNWYIYIEFVHWFIDVDVDFFVYFIFLNVNFFRFFFFRNIIFDWTIYCHNNAINFIVNKWTKNWSCYSQTKYLSKKKTNIWKNKKQINDMIDENNINDLIFKKILINNW